MLEKVFCIGLSRTGTTSLHAAAILLGFPSIHNPHQLSQNWIYGRINKKTIGPFVFYSDTPVAAYYKEFDDAFQNAKFILTVRDPDKWIDSVEAFFKGRRPCSSQTLKRDINRLAVYGVMDFHRRRFIDVYKRHCDDVFAYFYNRPSDLLVLNIETEGSLWQPLCDFLGTEPPPESYPHLRKPTLSELQFVLPEEVEAKQRLLRQRLAEIQ